jgi:hypothetical protein
LTKWEELYYSGIEKPKNPDRKVDEILIEREANEYTF